MGVLTELAETQAQCRVYAAAVARLEQENARLMRENERLYRDVAYYRELAGAVPDPSHTVSVPMPETYWSKGFKLHERSGLGPDYASAFLKF